MPAPNLSAVPPPFVEGGQSQRESWGLSTVPSVDVDRVRRWIASGVNLKRLQDMSTAESSQETLQTVRYLSAIIQNMYDRMNGLESVLSSINSRMADPMSGVLAPTAAMAGLSISPAAVTPRASDESSSTIRDNDAIDDHRALSGLGKLKSWRSLEGLSEQDYIHKYFKTYSDLVLRAIWGIEAEVARIIVQMHSRYSQSMSLRQFNFFCNIVRELAKVKNISIPQRLWPTYKKVAKEMRVSSSESPPAFAGISLASISVDRSMAGVATAIRGVIGAMKLVSELFNKPLRSFVEQVGEVIVQPNGAYDVDIAAVARSLT